MVPITVDQLPQDEIALSAIRSGGPGGQHVNKVATGIHLRFDVRASSLPDRIKQRLVALRDGRVTDEGMIVIKAQRFRSQDRNREDALQRLDGLLAAAQVERKRRRKTRPSKASVRRRLDAKGRRGETKRNRGPVRD
ncbi:MAG: class I peptide chain release factor [Gammaproteobacteria bacterium]|nr:class I peptide chain release factor [Gammaproteobacteria bacterium]